MEIGCIVKFKDGLYADEEGAFYRVIEDNGDRVFIKFICNMNFPPISVAGPLIGGLNTEDWKLNQLFTGL